MFKTLTSATMMIAAASVASAAPFPAPPTTSYTPPAANTCGSESLQVYFPAGTSAMTPASHAILQAAQERLSGCVVGPISLNASAADARSEAEAKSLTAARIETVTNALSSYELSGMHMSTQPDTNDPAHTIWTPMDRKVEIQVAAWAPEIS